MHFVTRSSVCPVSGLLWGLLFSHEGGDLYVCATTAGVSTCTSYVLSGCMQKFLGHLLGHVDEHGHDHGHVDMYIYSHILVCSMLPICIL